MHAYIHRALSTIAKTWRQSKRPSAEKWIKKIWCVCVYIYKLRYYSAIKKNEMMPFAKTWMNLETVVRSKVSQKERDKCYMISLLTQTNLSARQRQTQRHREYILVVAKEEREGRKDWESGIRRCKLWYIGWINNKDLLCSTRNDIQHPVISHNGKEYEKE